MSTDSNSESRSDEDDLELLFEGEQTEPVELTVESRAHGWRLDHYLSRLFPNYSRSQIQKAIESENVVLNGLKARSSKRLRVNDRVNVLLATAAEETHIEPEDIPLDVIYEDEHIIVINKPAQMVVHPGRGNYSGTMTAALQFHFDQLSDVAGHHRPGIVHRLDRDTTGVILIARNNQIHDKVSKQFENRTVKKEYRAIVRGIPELDGDFIKTHVCVHKRVREKMMVCSPGGRSREAVTFYETAEKFRNFAYINLHPHTGRTHQLRVHMQHIGTPIVADRQYIYEDRFTTGHITGKPMTGETLIARQALHAFRLTISHPVSGKEICFEAPLPEDFETTLRALRQSVATA